MDVVFFYCWPLIALHVRRADYHCLQTCGTSTDAKLYALARTANCVGVCLRCVEPAYENNTKKLCDFSVYERPSQTRDDDLWVWTGFMRLEVTRGNLCSERSNFIHTVRRRPHKEGVELWHAVRNKERASFRAKQSADIQLVRQDTKLWAIRLSVVAPFRARTLCRFIAHAAQVTWGWWIL